MKWLVLSLGQYLNHNKSINNQAEMKLSEAEILFKLFLLMSKLNMFKRYACLPESMFNCNSRCWRSENTNFMYGAQLSKGWAYFTYYFYMKPINIINDE